MKTLITFSLLLSMHSLVQAACVPARTVVNYPDDLPNVGMYHRIHPSGNYVLASAAASGLTSNRVVIIDLTGKVDGKTVAKTINTPMIDETYPVEGNWSLLASPNNKDGMRYYKFDDVLKKEKDADAVMNDKDHNQYYHSSAELPGSTPQEFKFRTMLWQGSRYRDYTIKYKNNGSVDKVEHTETQTACGQTLSSPILSKDGTEVATLTGRGTEIYKIGEGGKCELVDSLGYSTSKVNFSYPKAGSKGQIVFYGQTNIMVNGAPQASRGIFIYDRDSKTTRKLSLPDDQTPNYPGMTADGRVIYTNTQSREIITVDPNQLDDLGNEKADKSKCIQDGTGSAKAPAVVPPGGGNQQ